MLTCIGHLDGIFLLDVPPEEQEADQLVVAHVGTLLAEGAQVEPDEFLKVALAIQ